MQRFGFFKSSDLQASGGQTRQVWGTTTLRWSVGLPRISSISPGPLGLAMASLVHLATSCAAIVHLGALNPSTLIGYQMDP